MAYFGGKTRTGKQIAQAIKTKMKELNVVCNELIEPFCGMLGVTRHLVDDFLVTSSDYNEDLIFLLNHLKDFPDFTMPIITKERFDELKKQPFVSFEKSFAMFFCTYMAIYRGRYRANNILGKNGRTREITIENYNGLKNRIIPVINKFEFKNCDYTFWNNHLSSGGFVVYCDPPYVNTTQHYKTSSFNTELFWKTVKMWKEQGNYVFVSELSCPIEHEVIYSKELACSSSNKGKKMLDKLFYIL